MAPKKAPSAAAPPAIVSPSAKSANSNPLVTIYNNYLEQTPQRTKLIDAFLGFLVITGVLQFVYCVIAGNYVRLQKKKKLALL
jgi:oligosaccharyltransferase complex subunit epsilon